MTSRTHDAIAFAALVTAAVYFTPQDLKLTSLFAAVIAADIGSALPDIDQAGNRLWEMLPSGHNVGRIFRRIFYKHRTLTHSLIGLTGFYYLFSWLLPKFLNQGFVDINTVLYALMIGYISHLAGDALTEEGLPLLFPLRISFGFPPIRRMRIKTGKWYENLVVYPGTWLYLAFLISNKKEILLALFKTISS